MVEGNPLRQMKTSLIAFVSFVALVFAAYLVFAGFVAVRGNSVMANETALGVVVACIVIIFFALTAWFLYDLLRDPRHSSGPDKGG